MGKAVWLYLWLLDKMTSINKDGVGKVLGGKPIQYEEFAEDIKVSRTTYWRYLSILTDAGYVEVKRTPYGLIISIYKAKKIFTGKRDVSNMKQPDVSQMKRDVSKTDTDVAQVKHVIKTIQDNTITKQGAGYKKALEIRKKLTKKLSLT